MAIRAIRWQNFRGFKDTGWLDVRPITILIGGNNSGKSSILHPLLILKQTLESPRAQSALVLRGELVNTGTFADIIHAHNTAEKCTFGVRFHHQRTSDTAPPEIGEGAPASCEFTFKAEKAPGVVSLYRYEVRDAYDRTMLMRTKMANNRYTLGAIQNWAEPETEGDSALPNRSTSRTDVAARKVIRDVAPYHFLFAPDPIFNRAIRTSEVSANRPSGHMPGDADSFSEEVTEVQFSRFVSMYAAVVGFVEDHISEDLANVVYLGPLRDSPKRLYEISGDAPPNVGIRGQFSPEILLRGRKKKLFRQVNSWIRQFDLPGDLAFHQMTDTAFELNLDQKNDAPTSFADIGFGYSQLLPLIVQGLAAEQGDLLITEQPEIHLNPRLQSRLADFFIEVAKSHVGVLIETHSEHLILAFRRLVAEGKISADDVAIYYTESEQGASTIRRVQLQESGHIEAEDWPNGFFEDSLRQAFALSAAQARRLRDAK